MFAGCGRSNRQAAVIGGEVSQLVSDHRAELFRGQRLHQRQPQHQVVRLPAQDSVSRGTCATAALKKLIRQQDPVKSRRLKPRAQLFDHRVQPGRLGRGSIPALPEHRTVPTARAE